MRNFAARRGSGRGRSAAVAVTAVAALLLAACGDDGFEPMSPPSMSSDLDTDGLQIVPISQIDLRGADTAATAQNDPLDPAGDGNARCPDTAIAVAGAFTGDQSALGLNVRNGVQLAVDQHNEANRRCTIELKTFDTAGTADGAEGAAEEIIGDSDIAGLIGPGFSAEVEATGADFNRAGLATLTASATAPTLTDRGWRTFFRGVANDDVQGPAIANYLTGPLGKNTVCVVRDATVYGQGLAEAVTTALGERSDDSCAVEMADADGVAAAVDSVAGAAPEAVFFAGYYNEAAALLPALKQRLPEVTFVAGDAANDPGLIEEAGDAAAGTYLSCPCGPSTAEFRDEYRAAFDGDPGVFSVEAYDLASILIKGITEGKRSRADLLSFVRGYEGSGLARAYAWTATGELRSSGIWVYQVR